MSRLPRTELRLRLSARRAQATLWRTGWGGRCLAQHDFEPREDAVAEALRSFDDQGLGVPRQARICLDDGLLYFALLPALGPWRTAEGAARAHFAAQLGDEELIVACTLTPDGRRWLAVAVPAAVLQPLRDTLSQRSVALRELSAGLLDDLHTHRRELPRDGVVGLLREEGAMLVGLRAGSVCTLAWERCEPTATAELDRRIAAFGRRFAESEAPWIDADALELVLIAGHDPVVADALAASRQARVLLPHSPMSA